jgi:polyphenol oxidase
LKGFFLYKDRPFLSLYICMMIWLRAPNISAVHGFSTRHGGISQGPFHSMNLGGKDDRQENISANRKIALEELKIDISQVSLLKQLHGCDVRMAQSGHQEGDALVTNEKNVALAINVADCYPVLLHDPVNNVIGAAHAGWRGTVSKIAAATIYEMEKLGAQRENIRAAIGPGISLEKFEVGEEVLEQFRTAGFPSTCFSSNHIDLLLANQLILEEAFIAKKHIWTMNRCSTESDFFSYRRDQALTGRMWGLIMMTDK